MNFAILGREIDLARAEIESIASSFEHSETNVTLFEPKSADFNIDRAGGMIKYGEIVYETGLPDIYNSKQLAKVLDGLILHRNHKITFGISSYLSKEVVSSAKLADLVKELKLVLRGKTIPVRFVRPKNGLFLSSAEIIYNRLAAGQYNYEFVLFQIEKKFYIGQTLGVQDINSYSRRDRDKPCRDAKVGMLPPKLAQIMINLAELESKDSVIDPFCGSGAICAEAMLLGHDSIGADLNPRMIACTEKNLTWLKQAFSPDASYHLRVADATKDLKVGSKSAIVSETYLGQPLVDFPDNARLKTIQNEVAGIILSFLTLAQKITPTGYTIVICLPFWSDGRQDYYLPILDQILKIGYTAKQFHSVHSSLLLYRRPNQIVGRQVLVLKRV